MSTLSSHSIRLRPVEVSDAEFILRLRLDPAYNQHLSKVSGDIEGQRAWIARYKEDEAAGRQYYFIIERLDGMPCGTVRLYDLRPDSFSWGSWILNADKTRFAALESALLVYRIGFGQLGFPKSRFEVRKDNARTISFHQKFGATLVGEDELNHYFEFTQADFEKVHSSFEAMVARP